MRYSIGANDDYKSTAQRGIDAWQGRRHFAKKPRPLMLERLKQAGWGLLGLGLLGWYCFFGWVVYFWLGGHFFANRPWFGVPAGLLVWVAPAYLLIYIGMRNSQKRDSEQS